MQEYKGFKYWLVAPESWRIQFPGGHKTQPMRLGDETSVQNEIDNIIASLVTV